MIAAAAPAMIAVEVVSAAAGCGSAAVATLHSVPRVRAVRTNAGFIRRFVPRAADRPAQPGLRFAPERTPSRILSDRTCDGHVRRGTQALGHQPTCPASRTGRYGTLALSGSPPGQLRKGETESNVIVSGPGAWTTVRRTPFCSVPTTCSGGARRWRNRT